MHCLVVGPDDVESRLRLPRCAVHRLAKEVGQGHRLRRPDDLLIFCGQIAAEIGCSRALQPKSAVVHLDMVEDRCLGMAFLLILRGLAFVRRKCADVDQSPDAIVRARNGDDRSPVGVTYEHRGAFDAAKRRANRGGVVFDRVELILSGNHLIAIGLKQCHDLAVAGTVGPKAMGKHDAGFCGHEAPPRVRSLTLEPGDPPQRAQRGNAPNATPERPLART